MRASQSHCCHTSLNSWRNVISLQPEQTYVAMGCRERFNDEVSPSKVLVTTDSIWRHNLAACAHAVVCPRATTG
jgi:hypothetical protein